MTGLWVGLEADLREVDRRFSLSVENLEEASRGGEGSLREVERGVTDLEGLRAAVGLERAVVTPSIPPPRSLIRRVEEADMGG